MDIRNSNLSRLLSSVAVIGILLASTSSIVIGQTLIGTPLCPTPGGGQDCTRFPGASGNDVVDAVMQLIYPPTSQSTSNPRTSIFDDYHRLLHRIACVESNNGNDADTYRNGYHGGIWQVDEDMFDLVKTSTNQNTLDKRNTLKNSHLKIDWDDVVWEDLRQPLISALAAGLFLTTITDQIPGVADLDGQAKYWATHYDQSQTDVVELQNKFKEDVALCEGTACIAPQMDVAFLMDGSGSITAPNFVIEQEFVTNMIEAFDVGGIDNDSSPRVRFGVIQYDGSPVLEIPLGQFSDNEALVNAVNMIRYDGGSTRTGEAIRFMLSDLFGTQNPNPRDMVPKVAIVITDGMAQDDVTPPAETARAAGITLFAVGVGSGINEAELDEIANDPDEVYRFVVDDFGVLDNIRNVLTLTTCLTPTVLDISSDTGGGTIGGVTVPTEVQYFSIPIPDSGRLTYKLQITSGEACAYLSTVVSRPSSAFYNWKLTASEDNNYAQISIYVPNESDTGRKRRQTAGANPVLHVAIVNTGGDANEFRATIDEGDTTVVLQCDNEPCMNGGDCANRGLDSYDCQCAESFDGPNCEIDLSPSPGTILPCVSGLAVTMSTSTQLSVSWNPSSLACPADDFQLRYEVIGHIIDNVCPVTEVRIAFPWNARTSRVLSGLLPSSTYKVTVTPRSNGMTIGMSLSVEQTTDIDVPRLSPSNVRLTSRTDTSLTLSWDSISCSDRNGPIVFYRIQYQISHSQQVLYVISTIASVNLVGLECHTNYTFRVAAVTNAGDGPYSEDLQFATKHSPAPFEFESQPELRVTETSSTTAKISWRPSQCPASLFTIEYELLHGDGCLSGVRNRTKFSDIDGGNGTVDGLKPYSSYLVYVKALSAAGSLVDLEKSIQTLEDVPSASPANVKLIGMTSSVLYYSWDEVPCGNRRGLIDFYSYELVRLDTLEVIRGATNTRSINFPNLLQNRRYSFRVAARTSAGVGRYSEQVAGTPTPTNAYGCSPNPCSFGYHLDVSSSCQVARIIYIPLTVTYIDGKPAEFTNDLLDPISEKYQLLSCRVEIRLRSILNTEIQVFGASDGSVILDVAIVLDMDSVVSSLDIFMQLSSALSSDGSIGDDLIIKPISYGELQDLCPVGFCSNGGTCMPNIEPGSYCMCIGGFKGRQCDVASDNDSNFGTAILIILYGVVSVLVICLITMSCCCYMRYRRRQTLPSTIGVDQSSYPIDGYIDPFINQSPWTLEPVWSTKPSALRNAQSFFGNAGDNLNQNMHF